MPDQFTMADGIAGFLDYYRLLDGDEKGEAQVFLDGFFQALGHQGVCEAGAVLEDRVRSDGSVHYADLMWNYVVLFEMKKRGEDLRNHYTQAERYWAEKTKGRPRYVVTCNFDEFLDIRLRPSVVPAGRDRADCAACRALGSVWLHASEADRAALRS